MVRNEGASYAVMVQQTRCLFVSVMPAASVGADIRFADGLNAPRIPAHLAVLTRATCFAP